MYGLRNLSYVLGSSAIRHVAGLRSGSDAFMASLSKFQNSDSATSWHLPNHLIGDSL